MVARIHDRCSSPPQLDEIAALTDEGLLRLGINAIDLRLEHLPDDPATLITKAELMMTIHWPQHAVRPLRRALELGAEPHTAIALGVALARSGLLEEAMQVYAAHLERETDPRRQATTLGNIGTCLRDLGQEREAESYYRQALEIDPSHLGARWNLFVNLFGRGSHEEALEIAADILALPTLDQDDRAVVEEGRARVLFVLQRYKEALEAVDASLETDPEDPDRLAFRAMILLGLGDDEAAQACIARS